MNKTYKSATQRSYIAATVPRPQYFTTSNTASGYYNLIGNGNSNSIGNTTAGYCLSPYSVIVGGNANCIDTGSASGYYSCFNFIGNGQNNKVCCNVCHSSILGGFNHYTASNYSSILGGSGNQIPAGLQYAATFGNAVTAVNSNALHLENLWLKPGAYCCHNGPTPAGYFPLGTVYIDISTGSGYPLRIQRT